jgi:hypothetical protein
MGKTQRQRQQPPCGGRAYYFSLAKEAERVFRYDVRFSFPL